ncbi:hypothetical protein PG991_010442 [Apiospora marii]|uniref:Uncharacterized protein n=1 Tax=Apiospora marii TaxID=335849 RepID=A0ABR1RIH9_9PEZI
MGFKSLRARKEFLAIFESHRNWSRRLGTSERDETVFAFKGIARGADLAKADNGRVIRLGLPVSCYLEAIWAGEGSTYRRAHFVQMALHGNAIIPKEKKKKPNAVYDQPLDGRKATGGAEFRILQQKFSFAQRSYAQLLLSDNGTDACRRNRRWAKPCCAIAFFYSTPGRSVSLAGPEGYWLHTQNTFAWRYLHAQRAEEETAWPAGRARREELTQCEAQAPALLVSIWL